MRFLLLVAMGLSPFIGQPQGLAPISYNDSELIVDLGVGLWAWPLPMDYDADGDLDLFVGGRLRHGQYPLSPQSYLLENENGYFRDVTNEKAPALQTIGMVSSALWTPRVRLTASTRN